MNVKAKGLNAERELVRRFNQQDWRAVRVAGSGSIKYPAPDVIASKGSRRLVVECKTTLAAQQYLEHKQVHELQQFAASLLAEPWIGIRFNGRDWLFLSVDDMEKTAKNYGISEQKARLRGVSFAELVK